VIFLGKTKSAKERMSALRYSFHEHGMGFGYIANHAFINIDKLKSNQRGDFTQYYTQKGEEFEDKAKTLKEHAASNTTLKAAAGVGAGLLFGLPALAVGAVVVVADKIKNEIDISKDLTMYQYQILLREFVFNGLTEFMEG